MPSSVEAIMTLPEDHRPGAAFIALHRGVLREDQITQEIADLAFIGKKQLDAGGRNVMSILRRWTKTSGCPINYGGKRYGWLTNGTEINTAWALDVAWRHGLRSDDIAKYFCEITRSKVEKLPAKLAGLKQQILDSCSEPYEGDGRFGEIKD